VDSDIRTLFYDSLRGEQGHRKTGTYMDPAGLREAPFRRIYASVCRNKQDRNPLASVPKCRFVGMKFSIFRMSALSFVPEIG